MRLTISLADNIRARGRAYFKDGAVQELLPTARGYQATVLGSEDYEVRVYLDGNTVTDSSCTCPYYDTCKHVAAVVLAIEEAESTPSSNPRKVFAKASKELKLALGKQKKETLIETLLEFTAEDHFLRQKLFARFATVVEKKLSTHDIIEQAVSKIRLAARRLVLYEYHSAKKLAQHFEAPFDRVRTAIDRDDYALAFSLSYALAELAAEYTIEVDDSNGYMGGAYEEAKDLMEQATPAELPEDVRQAALQRLLIALAEGGHYFYEWELDLADLAASLVETPAEAKRLETVLDGKTFKGYAAEQIATTRVELKRRFGKAGSAETFEASQVHLPNIRRQLIEAAFAKTDYAEAKRLAGQGIAQHQTEHLLGLVADWKAWLLKIAVAEKDRERIIELCRADVLDGGGRSDMDTFATLKAQIDKAEWTAYFQDLLSALPKDRLGQRSGQLPLLAREKLWEQLLLALQQNPSLGDLDAYVDKFPVKYHADFVALYGVLIDDYLAANVNSQAYAYAAKVLVKIAALGDAERARALAIDWRKRYSQRSAMKRVLGAAGY